MAHIAQVLNIFSTLADSLNQNAQQKEKQAMHRQLAQEYRAKINLLKEKEHTSAFLIISTRISDAEQYLDKYFITNEVQYLERAGTIIHDCERSFRFFSI